jgi:nucleoside-diphosphate-sugar epimerase
MPVVVSGADQPLGRAVVLALLASGAGEVRATVAAQAAVADLVGRGVRTAVCEVTDPYRFGGVLADAHTLVHCARPKNTMAQEYLEASSILASPQVSGEPLDTLPDVLAAAEDSGLRRIVTVSSPDHVIPDRVPYELVVVRTIDPAPSPELVGALVDADRRRGVRIRCVIDL